MKLNQSGFSFLILLGITTLFLAGAIVVTTPQIKKLFTPRPDQTLQAVPSPDLTEKAPQYSEKQKLYLRNKARIQQELNLNDAQFDLLIESASKN